MSRFILYGGKGGVGKTTCAAATAVNLSKDEKTLVVSTDPAHSLSDSLKTELGSTPKKIKNNLWAVEIDPENAMKEYKEDVQKVPKELIPFGEISEKVGKGMGEVFEDALGAPGSDEIAVIYKFTEYMDTNKWDRVVFDTAPTGHTLKLLQLPEIMDSVMGRIIKIKSGMEDVFDSIRGLVGKQDNKKGSTINRLKKFKKRLEKARLYLTDPEYTDFRAVLTPETMVVRETQRLIEKLSTYNVPTSTIIVNKVLKDFNPNCEMCTARREIQNKSKEEIEDIFSDIKIIEVPLMNKEARGIDALEEIGKILEDQKQS